MQKSQGGAGWPGRLATCRHGTGRSTKAVWTEAGRCRSTGPWWTEAGRVGCARRGSARPRRRAMAASCELTVVALRCTGNRAEGTGVLAPASERDACVYGNTERPGRRVLVAERLDGGDATTMRSRTRLRKRGRTRRASTDSSPQREARGRSSSSGVRQPRESTAAGTSAPRLWW